MSDASGKRPEGYDYASGSASSRSSSLEVIFGKVASDDSNSDQKRTIFQKLDAGNNVNRSVSNIKTNMSVDPNKTIKNGAEVSNSLVAGKEQVQDVKSSMEKTWSEAKGDAIECLKEAAINQNLDAGGVVNDICPSEHPTDKGAALLAGATDLATGGMGSLITAGVGAAFISFEVSKQDKSLKPDQIKALIEDTMKIAQSGGPQDTRSGGGAADAPPQELKSDIAKLDYEGMKDLLEQNLDNQPEYQAALDVESDLNKVEENHMYSSRNYDPQNIDDSAQYDSIDVVLAGQSIGETKLFASNDSFYSSSVSDISEVNSKNVATLANEMRIQPDVSDSLRVSV